jgi:hypothetical protein
MSSPNEAILKAAIREKTELVRMLYDNAAYELGAGEYIELQRLKLKLKGIQIADSRRRYSGTEDNTPAE